MKRLFFTILSIAFITISCDDFLTENNPNAITNENFWKTKEDALSGLASVYGVLQYTNVMGAEEFVSNVRTDIGRSNPWESNSIALQNFTYNETTSYVQKKWNELYIGIFRANQVIENVKNIDFNENEKKEILAEAHFLRGLYYFWLVNLYNKGNIPMPLSVAQKVEDYGLHITERQEIINQIFDDFSIALENNVLPETRTKEELGRATWGAVTGILGQIYLYEKNYPKAIECFQKIIERKDLYELAPDISWNFDIEHEWNKESLFEVNFSTAVKDGTSGYTQDDIKGSEATTRPLSCAPVNAGGYRTVLPSCWLVDQMKKDKMDMNRPENYGREYSLRCEASIYIKGCGYPYYKLQEGQTEQNFDTSTESQAYVKKFTNWKGNIKEDNTLARSGINERILRLADIYLMYAEALIENEDTPTNRRTAIDFINKVRYRSALTQLKYDEYDTKEKIMNHLMFVERPLELCFEGHCLRWNDLKRWNIIQTWYPELANMKWIYEDKTEPIIQYGLSSQQFNPEKHYYFMIPNDEMNNNPNL